MNAQDKSAATQISIRQIHPFRNHPFKVAQDKSAATQISIRQIHPFRNHPFKVLDDDRMKDLYRKLNLRNLLYVIGG